MLPRVLSSAVVASLFLAQSSLTMVSISSCRWDMPDWATATIAVVSTSTSAEPRPRRVPMLKS